MTNHDFSLTFLICGVGRAVQPLREEQVQDEIEET